MDLREGFHEALRWEKIFCLASYLPWASHLFRTIGCRPDQIPAVCTAESCAFRDRHEEVATADTQIVGISPQSVSSHRRFANTFGIEFPLLADQRKQVIRAYGVDGPMGFGVRRVTFHIDSSGVVQNRVVSDLMVSSHTDLLRKAVVQHQPA